jgi:membrane-associated protease RseP (regulator of RpoE activity)
VPLSARDATIHIALFVASCVTTWWAGGAAFSATLMGILVCHEAGHYFVGRRHGVPVSLPYFIPLPPQVSLGTMGAVIRMDEPISDRNALFDVGAAGPIAGLVVAVPLLVIGLHLSEVGPLTSDSMIEGNSILYAVLKYAVFGEWLPGGGVDVQLHPMAFAGWVGLLITMINLIPIGQLDGGHVVRAWLGERHERLSAVLHRVLPVIAAGVGAVMLAIAHGAGMSWPAALGYATSGAMPWLVWTLLLSLMRRGTGGRYHPPVDGEPLSPGRRKVAWLIVVVWILILTPVPMRPAI